MMGKAHMLAFSFLIFAFIVFPPTLAARNTCTIGIGPALDSIARNTAFLIETCGCEGEPLLGIGREFPAYLVSDGHDTVPMRLIRYLHAGQDQALIGPGRYLRAGERYHVHVPKLEAEVGLDWPEGVSWVVKDGLSDSRVGYYASPQLKGLKGERWGKDSILVAELAFKPLDPAEFYYVLFTASDPWSGEEIRWVQALAPWQTHLMTPESGSPCGPKPRLFSGGEYELVLTLLGLDGDEGRRSEPIRISDQ